MFVPSGVLLIKMKLLEDFLDGFKNVWYCLESYNDGEWGYGDFWEGINVGWMRMEIYQFDDPFTRSISKQRQTLLGQKPPIRKVQLMIDVSGAFTAYDDNGFTICAQPNREKADRCIEYYKQQNPTSIIQGEWN